MEINRLYSNRPQITSMHMYGANSTDILQTPLQPLAENLNAEIYSIFEIDNVKYDIYGKAFLIAMKAFKDRLKLANNGKQSVENGHAKEPKDDFYDEDSDPIERPIVVMVLGAGRGPLVSKVVSMADDTKTEVIKMISKKYQVVS